MSYFGWWDYEPDQLWRTPPQTVTPLTRDETELLKDGFYPATLYVRDSPPPGLPAPSPWIRRDAETPLAREALPD